ncbi:MAG TPA: glycosyltransferase [Longimicrobiaceae bacterium]|nr:glycosyltransferase [Longimicrobiaceae bacterium]
MKLVVFGLTISSSWGNGHATLWRGLVRALIRRGHRVVFFEKDVPYYAGARDLWEIPGGELVLYPDWESVLPYARSHLADADVAMVTSYCADGVAAATLAFDSPAQLRAFYDMDTPVTLDGLKQGRAVPYLPNDGLAGFDLVLSFTGGEALQQLRTRLGARRTAPLYGHADPDVHRPVPPLDGPHGDLSYLGTYAEDRQAALETLFIEPARRMPDRRFLLAGAQYPHEFPWTRNVFFHRHLPPADHPAFFRSAALTLNVTRRAMAEMGFCPSGRLFEAAACGVPILTDTWDGLGAFFTPGDEILTARTTDDAVAAISLPREELARIARRARERTLAEHTSERRAAELEALLDAALRDDPWDADALPHSRTSALSTEA